MGFFRFDLSDCFHDRVFPLDSPLLELLLQIVCHVSFEGFLRLSLIALSVVRLELLFNLVLSLCFLLLHLQLLVNLNYSLVYALYLLDPYLIHGLFIDVADFLHYLFLFNLIFQSHCDFIQPLLSLHLSLLIWRPYLAIKSSFITESNMNLV